MSKLVKALWTLRAIVLGPTFKRIGFPSYIGRPTLILGSRRMSLGRRVRIMPGLRAETHGDGSIEIEDNTVIGQNFHITAMGPLRIGSGTLITGFVSVTDIDHQYSDVSRPVHEQEYVHSRTDIGKNCFLGMGARIQAGTILGDGCIVGANAVVRGTFPPHSVIVGAPGRVVKKYNSQTESWDRC